MSLSQLEPSTTPELARGENVVLPESMLRVVLSGEHAIPAWLTSRDEPWVRALIGEMDGLAGCTFADFQEALNARLIPMSCSWGAAPGAVRGVAHLMSKMWTASVVASAPPAEIRQILFELAASPIPREEAIARTAQVLHICPQDVLAGAYADRPGARRLVAPDVEPSATRMVELYNLALARGLMMRSTQVVARVRSQVRSVMRYAHLKRLICTCTAVQEGSRLELSGPLSLFRQTTRYGHALACFLPALMVTVGWALRARCVLRKEPRIVRMSAGDPIASTFALPRQTDSSVERRLQRDIRRLGSPWIIERETEAVRAGQRVFFPDFTLRRGTDKVLVEIVGFYTPEYLRAKIATLRAAGLHDFIVCVDESLACSDDEFVADGVLRYRKFVDAARLVELANEVAEKRDGLPAICATFARSDPTSPAARQAR
jgi:predicted nuclease of restriction endonuclease-like RecB superfamily